MNTIFDLGLHEGHDTSFYLRKGFRVVALEANPLFCRAAEEHFAREIAQGRLIIVEKALAARADGYVAFYVRADKNGWSSLYSDVAERDGIASTRIEIAATTLGRLFAEHGIPYFLKCDIEGAEDVVLQQLATEREKPRFVSVEAGDASIDLLAAAGYVRFQMINQGNLKLFHRP
jgi:FkbM family methyltransferase